MIAGAIANCGPEFPNAAMQNGTDIHRQMANIVGEGGLQGLKAAKDNLSLEVAVRILAMRAWSTITTLGFQSADVVLAEFPLPICPDDVPAGLNFAGTADLVVVDMATRRALVIDYKSGMTTQEPSYEHPQLVAYAVLAYFSLSGYLNEAEPEVVYGQIIPAAGKMSDPLRVDKENVSATLAQLIELCQDAADVSEPPTPGPHCGWCYAAGKTCDEFKRAVGSAIVQAKHDNMALVDEKALADAYYTVRRLASLQDSIANELKRRIVERGGPVAGWDLKLRKGTVKLTGHALAAACQKWGIAAQDLGISINIKDVGDAVAKKLGVKKVDGLSLVETSFGTEAVHSEGSQVLTPAEGE